MKAFVSQHVSSNVGEGATDANEIPVLRPLLPTSELILPYLKRIDAERVYSNFGPLALELQSRLAELFDTGEKSVIAANSGTAALMLAILANAGPGRPGKPLAMIPGLTFAATAVAAERCGYEPYFVDIDVASWLLDPERLARHPLIGNVGVAIPVATFGKPVPQDPWLRFQAATGVTCVIDGAASFASVADEPQTFVGRIPVAISFHATKSFGSGEGGCVVWTDGAAEQKLGAAANFGFYGSRQSVSASSNSKMSEYHAAVALAELDGWPAKQRLWAGAIDHYRNLNGEGNCDLRLVLHPQSDFIYPLLDCANAAEAKRVVEDLTLARVGSRYWYGAGMTSHPHFSRCGHDDLAVSAALASRLVGLPAATDLAQADVARILAAAARGVSRRSHASAAQAKVAQSA